MAARLNKLHQDSVRAKIQGSQLVNRLQNHALGKCDMESTQVQAAKILLDKLVSNAPAEVNIGGQADNPVNHTVAVAPMLTPEQWAATFGPK